MPKIKVIVVDNDIATCKMALYMVSHNTDLLLYGDIPLDKDTIPKIEYYRPDVVCLEATAVEEPYKDLIATMIENYGCRVLLIAKDASDETAAKILEGMEQGALDYSFIDKGLSEKIRDCMYANVKGVRHISKDHDKSSPGVKSSDYAVIIGSSTGGPAALGILVRDIPKKVDFPIFIIQHLPKRFTTTLSKRLNTLSNIPVHEVIDGQKVEKGNIYLAPGGADMTIQKEKNELILRIKEEQTKILTPSIDTFMESAVDKFPKIIGVILTGMGGDGVVGMASIKHSNGVCIVQDEETSAVYGMGKDVVDKGLAHYILPLEKIWEKIEEVTKYAK